MNQSRVYSEEKKHLLFDFCCHETLFVVIGKKLRSPGNIFWLEQISKKQHFAICLLQLGTVRLG
jgi:hypothetical protein